MGNDKVEPSKSLGAGLAEVHRMKRDVSQAERFGKRLPGSDRTSRQVKTDKLAGRQLESHSDEISADSAT